MCAHILMCHQSWTYISIPDISSETLLHITHANELLHMWMSHVTYIYIYTYIYTYIYIYIHIYVYECARLRIQLHRHLENLSKNSRILKVSVSEWIACVHVHVRVRKTSLVRKTSPIGIFPPVGMRSPVIIFGARVTRLVHMWREVGGWGRDLKKCTGRDWGMGSSTI